jgi:hypothetical protein
MSALLNNVAEPHRSPALPMAPRRAGRARARAVRAASAIAVLLLSLSQAAGALAATPQVLTHVDRAAEADGVTVTVTDVYFDASWSYIGVDVSLADDLRASATGFALADWHVTDQFGREPITEPGVGYGTWCSGFATEPMHCVITWAPFAEPADVRNLAATFELDSVWLLSSGGGKGGDGGISTVDGPWTVQFAASYDHVQRGNDW